jgi:hypothetical protein
VFLAACDPYYVLTSSAVLRPLLGAVFVASRLYLTGTNRELVVIVAARRRRPPTSCGATSRSRSLMPTRR